ncbi:MAG: hypothetical protein KZY61_00960 [Clostridiaceae bacterium]|nr:hypothetical protein [Clostridiaceae bacterium]MBW4860328.1 hypothetical protein [Clostridiaceae bacterium]MBW4867225.1 hypothetical protein [Clostridiaceae bacterium]
MDVIIKRSAIQFKNPTTGQPTRAVEEHYNGRRIVADINGEERMFRLKKDEIPFIVDEDEMIEMIEKKLIND